MRARRRTLPSRFAGGGVEAGGGPPDHLVHSHSAGFQVPGFGDVRTGVRNDETAGVTSASVFHLSSSADAIAA